MKIDLAQLRIGDRVHYQPSHYADNEWENGLIKMIRENRLDVIWVVYNCAGDWDHFKDYTSACTKLEDLKLGWRFE